LDYGGYLHHGLGDRQRAYWFFKYLIGADKVLMVLASWARNLALAKHKSKSGKVEDYQKQENEFSEKP